jgi:Protein of unknown function (DUF3738)
MSSCGTRILRPVDALPYSERMSTSSVWTLARAGWIAIFYVAIGFYTPGPSAQASFAFEAASVKRASPDSPPGQGIQRAPGGRFNAVNAPLRFLITYAYQIQNYQLVGGPDWIANERFNIVAKMEGAPPSIVTSGCRSIEDGDPYAACRSLQSGRAP